MNIIEISSILTTAQPGRNDKLLFKVEFFGKMKDFFQYLGSKLPRKRALFSILLVTTFNTLSSP